MKRRKGYRRKQGHRQKFTEVRVVEIDFGTGESVKPDAEKAEKPKKAKAAKAEKAETKKAKAAKAEKAEAKKPEVEAKAEPESVEIDVTPAAAELAEEEGIDLTALEGTGKDGRILKSDVQDAIKAREGE